MLADIVPFTLSDAKEFMQVFGWPGIFAVFFYYCMWPVFKDHLKSVSEFLDVSRSRIVSTDDSLREIRTGVAVIVKYVAPLEHHPEWIKKERVT